MLQVGLSFKKIKTLISHFPRKNVINEGFRFVIDCEIDPRGFNSGPFVRTIKSSLVLLPWGKLLHDISPTIWGAGLHPQQDIVSYVQGDILFFRTYFCRNCSIVIA